MQKSLRTIGTLAAVSTESLEIRASRAYKTFSSLCKRHGIIRFGVLAGVGTAFVFANQAQCASGSSEQQSSAPAAADSSDDDVAKWIETHLVPQLSELGISGGLGVCSGLALKRLGREAATALGLIFVIIQSLSYFGYININYTKVSKDALRVLDADGDGKLTPKDVVFAWNNLKEILGTSLPSVASFSSGFLLGAYLG